MYQPLSLFIALRYLRAKRRNHFISFISFISTFGIALGVTVLITVLSVMNGFDDKIKNRVFGVARHVTISGLNGTLADWPTVAKKIAQNKEVIASTPYVDGQGMLVSDAGGQHFSMIVGVDPKLDNKVSAISSSIMEGSLDDLQSGKFNIILGQKLAETLGVMVHDKVLVMVGQATLTPAGLLPQYRSFTVSGIFNVGNFDGQLAFINLQDAQKLFQYNDHVSGLRLKLSDLYLAPSFSEKLKAQFPSNYLVQNWTQEYGSFFDTLRLEKTMIFLLLTFIIIVAAFNLVATLVMIVNDKRADIAILRTIGAPPRTILGVFMLQGTIVGIVGTIIGLIGGLLLASYITNIVNWIQDFFNVQLLSSSFYFVNELPSLIQARDVFDICIMAIFMSLLATIYPAWNASRTQPAEALRYE